MSDLSPLTSDLLSRRDFGKGIAAILAAGVAPSVLADGFRRGLAGRLAALSGGGGKTYDVTDYVGWGTSSLLWMLDGKRNVSPTSEHDNSATSWNDLCGSGKNITGVNNFVGASWSNDGLNTIAQRGEDVHTGNVYYNNKFFADDSYYSDGESSQSLFMFDEVFDGGSSSYNLICCSGNSPFGTNWLNGAWGISLGGRQNEWKTQQIVLTSLETNRYYHVTSTYERATRKITAYLDGEKKWEGVAKSDLPLYGGYLMFNYSPWGKIAGIDGRHFAHRLYGKVLTAEEVAANYAVDCARFGIA